MFITTTEDLNAFCARAKKHGVLAVDTEFLREKTYHPRLCLIQLGTPEEVCAVDPFCVEDFSSLKDLLEDENIVKVLHACSQDMEVIKYALSCVVNPVFDTQVAAAFLGYRMQLGYGALVEAYAGVTLPKAESMTDWSLRPLDAQQIAYAEDDVRYLPGIYDKMMSELIDKNRLGWLIPEMNEVCDPAKLEVHYDEAYRKVKRANSLTRKQLAIAREVASWREKTAEKRNIPRKWVLGDEVLIEICKRCPKNADKLRRLRGLTQLNSADCTSILAAVKAGLNCPAELMPEIKRRPRTSSDTDSVVDLMYSVLRIIAAKNGIAAQVIATRDDLYDYLNNSKKSSLASGWRHEILGQYLTQLLEGQIGLTVKDGKVEIL